MGMPTQRALKDMAVGVHKARQESYTREDRNIRGWQVSFPPWRDRGNTPVVRDGDHHIGLQALWGINIIRDKMLHKLYPLYRPWIADQMETGPEVRMHPVRANGSTCPRQKCTLCTGQGSGFVIVAQQRLVEHFHQFRAAG